MCLVIVAVNVHPRYAMVIAANRDEFHARAAIPAAWGTSPPFSGILAGRDVEAGGTWLGVRSDGRWALLTNVREGRRVFKPAAPSRGALVPAVLNDKAGPLPPLTDCMRNAAAYNGFNILAGNAIDVTWASNRATDIRALTPGVHGLSNASLDTPWPKVMQTSDAVAKWSAHDIVDLEPVFAALAERTVAPDEALPSTGVSLEWERLLSSPFIVTEDYGTRCSTVLAIDRRGVARFIERTFDRSGTAIGEVDAVFALDDEVGL